MQPYRLWLCKRQGLPGFSPFPGADTRAAAYPGDAAFRGIGAHSGCFRPHGGYRNPASPGHRRRCAGERKGGGFIRDGYDEKLDAYRAASRNGKDWLSKMEADERASTGIKTLKIGYNRVFGYYIEVSRAAADQVPYSYQRKQTLANCERYITPELKELEDTILGAEEKSIALEYTFSWRSARPLAPA